MERMTLYDGDYYYPHCMKGSTCGGRGASEKCNKCEFNERICATLGEYEDTGLTPPEIMELKERDTAKKMLPLTYKPLLEAGWRYECPNCGCAVGENIYHPDVTKDYEFCSMCGQKLEE